MAENIFSQALRKQLAKGKAIPAPQVRSIGYIPDARSPIGSITNSRLRGFNARQIAGRTPFVPGATNIGPMPTTPNPRLPMRPLTSGAARSASGLIGKTGSLLGPIGLVADAIYTGQDLKSSLDRGEGFARIPGLVQKLFSGNKNDTTTYSSVPGFIGPVAQPTPGLIGPPVPSVESRQGAWTIKGWDPNAARTSTQETPPLAPILPPPPGLPPEERAYQAELARTQQMMASNPYMPQMNLYAQGQAAMQTPEDMATVRDLGLAINRSMYGDVLTPKTPNPLMAGLTPPPGAQPNIPMDQEGRIGQLDAAAEGVQEFMRKYAEGMKKRQEEE